MKCEECNYHSENIEFFLQFKETFNPNVHHWECEYDGSLEELVLCKRCVAEALQQKYDYNLRYLMKMDMSVFNIL